MNLDRLDREVPQDTLLAQCPSPPKCMNGYRQIYGVASHPGEIEILVVASLLVSITLPRR